MGTIQPIAWEVRGNIYPTPQSQIMLDLIGISQLRVLQVLSDKLGLAKEDTSCGIMVSKARLASLHE